MMDNKVEEEVFRKYIHALPTQQRIRQVLGVQWNRGNLAAKIQGQTLTHMHWAPASVGFIQGTVQDIRDAKIKPPGKEVKQTYR